MIASSQPWPLLLAHDISGECEQSGSYVKGFAAWLQTCWIKQSCTNTSSCSNRINLRFMFLRQRKPTSSPKNVEKNLLNSYNLTSCKRFSHLRTEVEYVVKNYSTARLMKGSWMVALLMACFSCKQQASGQGVGMFILKTHLQKVPLSRLGEIWRIPVSDLQLCTHWNQLTLLDVKSCGGPIGSLQLLGCCLRCIGESTPITPTNRSTFFCNRGFFFANITNASSNTRYAWVTLCVIYNMWWLSKILSSRNGHS